MTRQLTIGDTAPAGIVINVADEAVGLSTFWANGPTFLTFLRHFG